MKTFISIVAAMYLNACASNAYEVKTVETKLNVKGEVNGQKLGINDKNEAIMQEEVRAQDELRIAQVVSEHFEEQLRNEAAELKRCKRDLADPRLGGRGELAPDTDTDVAPYDAVKEEFGLADDGDLKIVRKSYYVDRLKSARAYSVTIQKMLKLIKRHNEECTLKLGIARNKAGLPSERVMAQGYFNEKGQWVETRQAEQTVGDAFEIQAGNKATATEPGH
jgi:hypothetical protein